VEVKDPDTGIPKRDKDTGEVTLQTPFRRRRKKSDPEFIPGSPDFLGDALWVPSKAAYELIEQLHKARAQPLWRFLVSLNIRHVGPVAARAVAQAFGSLEAIVSATPEELAAVDGVGEVIARSILDWWETPWHQDIVSSWRVAGVSFVNTALPVVTQADTLRGLTVVVTGAIPGHTRDSAEEAVRGAGGKPTSSVSASTSVVVAGEGAGSKRQKALDLGIPVIEAEDFTIFLANGLPGEAL